LQISAKFKGSKVKSFPSHMGHGAALISISYSPQPDTSLHCEATNTGLVYHVACLFKFKGNSNKNEDLNKKSVP